MAASPRHLVDSLWLGWFAMSIAAILLVDAVPSYPAWLYKPPGSPLHFLQLLRDMYIEMYDDPFVQEHLVPRWMHPLFFIELFFQLPVAVYGVYRLCGKAGTTGPLELLFLVYGLEVALSTLLCINDVFYWDPLKYSAETKRVFILQLYGPFFVAPLALAVDMYWRLYLRVTETNDVKKDQ